MLLFLVSSVLGHAAGFYTTTSGTKALGRGGAYVAGVDDLSAQFHNPAGLVRLDGTQIMLDLTAVDTTASFERASETYTDTNGTGKTTTEPVDFDEASNSGSPFTIPSIAVGSSFGLEDWFFAVGFYPPYAPDVEWPEHGSQRYSLVDSLEWQGYGGPTVAHRFSDWLSVGVGLQWTFLRANREFYLTSCDETLGCVNPGTDSSDDIKSTLTSIDSFEPSANLGVLIEPSDSLSFGLFVEPPIHYKNKGTLTTHIPDTNDLRTLVDAPSYSDDDVTVLVNFPLIIKLGAQLELGERAVIELDAGYQGWSSNEDIRVTDLDITIGLSEAGQQLTGASETAIKNDVILHQNYVDSYSAHLGGEWSASDSVDLRAGAFYETTAIPSAWMNVSELDGDKIGIGIGASWRASDHFAIDLGVARNQFLTQTVTDSESPQVVLHLDPGEITETKVLDGAAVGNGTYHIATMLGSLGLRYTF